jgi:hypothetical protein
MTIWSYPQVMREGVWHDLAECQTWNEADALADQEANDSGRAVRVIQTRKRRARRANKAKREGTP